MIAIVNCGWNNVGSVQNMLRKLGAPAQITSSPQEILSAERLILPGIGAFDAGMEYLNQSGLRSVLTQRVVQERVPLLAICLGMQMLTESSEEGSLPGLGWIKGRTRKFSASGQLRVPHMGWNSVEPQAESALFAGAAEWRFYFVHSYFVETQSDRNVAAVTTYGDRFVSSVQQENIWGVQFHPEKSHNFGLKLFENFLRYQ